MKNVKPLAGKRIAVTRARHQAPALEALIRDFGGAPVAYPCIDIAPPTDRRPLEDCLRRLGQFDWLLLTSSNTVSAIANGLSALGIRPADSGIRLAAAGPATAAAARKQLAQRVQHVPAEFGAAQLARSLPLRVPCRILLPQSDLASASTAALLRARGALVTTVVAYRTVLAAGGADLPAMISRRELDALTFTSPSAVSFFRRRCLSSAALLLPAACIGSSTSAAAREHGFGRLIKPEKPTLSDMIAALAAYWAPASAADQF
ncbi:MAG: uroporphyrinogen-III synthase [Chloroflexi bacterium]|nr:uroporphyrinogen-III synthase [Chloroflexota bacterium]